MRYVVAVSGGVDSVVLLHMMTKQYAADQLIVAHFDHGIRPDSADDSEFVRGLAGTYNVAFETKREELGNSASEELARERRYAFLRAIAKKYDAKIMTAHHADDIVETIAINLVRGTGWRGLAVLGSREIERPLLGMTKREVIAYAEQYNLQWHEDSTNKDTKYLRNDLRQKLKSLDEQTHQLLRLYRDRQLALSRMVDNEVSKVIGSSPYDRHLFISVPESAGLELLRAVFVREVGSSPTRPQLTRALHAIKVLHAGKRYDVADGISLQFTRTQYVVELTAKVVS
jgi:tRNA(Ile)-lysidine synthase